MYVSLPGGVFAILCVRRWGGGCRKEESGETLEMEIEIEMDDP